MTEPRFQLNIRTRGLARDAALDDLLRRAFSEIAGDPLISLTAIDVTIFVHGRRFGLEVDVHADGKHTLTMMREGSVDDEALFSELAAEALRRVRQRIAELAERRDPSASAIGLWKLS